MEDEGNVVLEAAPVVEQSDGASIDNSINVTDNSTTSETPLDEAVKPTQPMIETGAGDIGVIEPTLVLDTPIIAPNYMKGSKLDDLQIIEMFDQKERSAVYTESELKKAGVDSQLYSAEAYNNQRNRQAAIDEYRVAEGLMQKQAELTGWYIAPEDHDMLLQQSMAKAQLEKPGITNMERTKALKTIATVDGFFSAKGISTKGVGTLQKFVYERTLDVQRAENAIAAGAYSNMVKNYERGQIESVWSALEIGNTPEEIMAMYRGSMDPNDINAILNVYIKDNHNYALENTIKNMTNADLTAYSTDTDYTYTVDDVEYEVKKFSGKGNTDTEYFIYETKDKDGNTMWRSVSETLLTDTEKVISRGNANWDRDFTSDPLDFKVERGKPIPNYKPNYKPKDYSSKAIFGKDNKYNLTR